MIKSKENLWRDERTDGEPNIRHMKVILSLEKENKFFLGESIFSKTKCYRVINAEHKPPLHT